jgi:prefoldin subunit 5
MDERFDRIDASIGELKQSNTDLKQYLMAMRTEIAQRFDVIENRLTAQGAILDVIDSQSKPFTKAVLDFGATASNLSKRQWDLKDANTAIADRLEQLEAKVSRLVDPAA